MKGGTSTYTAISRTNRLGMAFFMFCRLLRLYPVMLLALSVCRVISVDFGTSGIIALRR
jgi:hypothetical protein